MRFCKMKSSTEAVPILLSVHMKELRWQIPLWGPLSVNYKKIYVYRGLASVVSSKESRKFRFGGGVETYIRSTLGKEMSFQSPSICSVNMCPESRMHCQ